MERLLEWTVKDYLNETINQAKKSTCLRAKCGATIVNERYGVIGRGFNSPPRNLESQRRCLIDKNEYDKKVTDKTCCVHAEQRAIFDAFGAYGMHAFKENSTLFFIRVDNEGNPIPAGKPYCTICSKSALDVGISNWVLQHESGLYLYTSEEYNDLSFNFRNN